jgi:hypothetical protein
VGSEPVTKADENIQVQVSWAGLDTAVVPVNQFITSVGLPAAVTGEPDGIQLVLGYLSPPLLLGNQEEVLRKVRELGEIKVEARGRFVLTRSRTEELIKVLQTALTQYDQVREVARGRE